MKQSRTAFGEVFRLFAKAPPRPSLPVLRIEAFRHPRREVLYPAELLAHKKYLPFSLLRPTEPQGRITLQSWRHSTSAKRAMVAASSQRVSFLSFFSGVMGLVLAEKDAQRRRFAMFQTRPKSVAEELRTMKLSEAAKKVEDGIEETLTY